ncbi:hypothetical protein [Brachybacterium sp. AOP29-B2-41]|uniref:hypothetical protein n=1 Tax=Brachybacterium sp. AOP29-B2-41 TaxID=3457704 RepID=UPI004033991B
MTARPEVAASLWSTPPEARHDEARRLRDAGINRFHWDRADGVYAPAGGITAADARNISEAVSARSEAHLMVSEPLMEVAVWAAFCDLVIVHDDAPDLDEVLALIRRCGSRAGVAVMGGHSVPDLDRTVDVLVMSIQPGTAGAPFNASALETAREACAVHDRVGLDGGVTEHLLEKVGDTGVSWVVSGNALVSSGDPGRWVRTRPDDQ